MSSQSSSSSSQEYIRAPAFTYQHGNAQNFSATDNYPNAIQIPDVSFHSHGDMAFDVNLNTLAHAVAHINEGYTTDIRRYPDNYPQPISTSASSSSTGTTTSENNIPDNHSLVTPSYPQSQAVSIVQIPPHPVQVNHTNLISTSILHPTNIYRSSYYSYAGQQRPFFIFHLHARPVYNEA